MPPKRGRRRSAGLPPPRHVRPPRMLRPKATGPAGRLRLRSPGRRSVRPRPGRCARCGNGLPRRPPAAPPRSRSRSPSPCADRPSGRPWHNRLLAARSERPSAPRRGGLLFAAGRAGIATVADAAYRRRRRARPRPPAPAAPAPGRPPARRWRRCRRSWPCCGSASRPRRGRLRSAPAAIRRSPHVARRCDAGSGRRCARLRRRW